MGFPGLLLDSGVPSRAFSTLCQGFRGFRALRVSVLGFWFLGFFKGFRVQVLGFRVSEF